MHTVPATQGVCVSALIALALLIGALLISAPKASASKSQCSERTVCVWENSNFTGKFSQWSEEETGCHPHPGNPKIRSGWNRSIIWNVRFGGQKTEGPGLSFALESGANPITGEICWTQTHRRCNSRSVICCRGEGLRRMREP
jgi:Peptidase inhibitor family I36